MPAILKHEKRKFGSGLFLSPTPPTSGEGLGDVITGITNFAQSNKDLISAGAKSISAVANAGSKIAEVVKKSKELNELQAIREAHNKKLQQQDTTKKEIPQSIKDKIGQGFKKL